MPKAKAMTPEEFLEKMREQAENYDIEKVHSRMDDLLCEVLESLGYEEGVRVFQDNEKWYA